MNYLSVETVKSTVAGRWLQRAAEPVTLNGVGIDTRQDLAGKVFFAIQGDNFDGHDFLAAAANAGSSLLIVERDIPAAKLPAGAGVIHVDSTRKAMGRLALAYRRTHRGKFIAVVGSAGKTTTKRLIDAVLATSMQGSASPKSFNNDIGVPLTVLNAKPSDKYVVVEVGTNHLSEVAHLASLVEPDIAVITMIGREHLEGLGSLENIAAENAAILDYLRPGGLAVLNADTPLLRKHTKRASSIVMFGEAPDADLRLTARGEGASTISNWWIEVNQRTRFALSQPGKHNAINALAAVAVGRRLGVSDTNISEGLAAAEGAPMRMAVQSVRGMTVYNDAYNANPESMLAALDTFAEITVNAKRRILILGDMLELGPTGPDLHREIGRRIVHLNAGSRVDQAILVGALAKFIAEPLAAEWPAGRVTLLAGVDGEAGARVASMLQSGDAVLIKGSRGVGLERLLPMMERPQRDVAGPVEVATTSKPGLGAKAAAR